MNYSAVNITGSYLTLRTFLSDSGLLIFMIYHRNLWKTFLRQVMYLYVKHQQISLWPSFLGVFKSDYGKTMYFILKICFNLIM